MFELFLNPWTMAAGAALISAPILIHLINRLRYRRVRWAAMEFLLKSQKRNRRKVMIEQLLLLMLRILAVLLFGFLLARFLGFDPRAENLARPTLHVVLLDDTPSMGDFWREDGAETDSFAVAKRQIAGSIAASVARVTAPQELVILRLSELDAPYRLERVTPELISGVDNELKDRSPSPVRVPLMKGLDQAQAVLTDQAEFARVLHLVSDFRSQDWSGPAENELRAKFEELRQADVAVHLVDVAHPERRETSDTTLFHDNLAIVDLRPETRVTARFTPVEFTVEVANFSNSEVKNVRVGVKLNGMARAEGSINLPSLPPNQVTSGRITISPDRVGTEENPLDRFNLVSAHIEQEESGLKIDNVRYAFIEVRDRVPILIVEGDTSKRVSSETVKDADGFYLERLFRDAQDGYEVVVRGPTALEQPNLQEYASIFVCNVRELSEAARSALTDYVRNGGGVAFFVGPNVRPQAYTALYDEGKGIFPVPLADQPTEPLPDDERLGRLFSFQMQMFPRDKEHPALEHIYHDTRGERLDDEDYNKFLRFVVINRYWPVPRLQWDRQAASAQELITFPNYNSMGVYEPRVNQALVGLPIEDPDHEKFKAALVYHRDQIRRVAASTRPLHELAAALEGFLKDSGRPDDDARPNLQEFWAKPGVAAVRRTFESLLETVRYGDPLYVAKQYGSGRTVAFLTTANNLWNDLDGPGKPYWPPLVIEMQKYLASAGTDVNRSVGSRTELTFDRSAYQPRVRAALMAEADPDAAGQLENSPSFVAPIGEEVMEVDGERFRLNVSDTRQPGVYVYTLEARDPADPSRTVPEYKAMAFNVDAIAEGDLRRAARDDLLKVAEGAQLHTVSEDWESVLNPRRRDYSELPWVFLVLLLVLIAEQAMAVRLSYHSAGGN